MLHLLNFKNHKGHCKFYSVLFYFLIFVIFTHLYSILVGPRALTRSSFIILKFMNSPDQND